MVYTLMAVIFILGYLAIAFEHNLHIDKAASALFTAVLVWAFLVFGAESLFISHPDLHPHLSDGFSHILNEELRHHLAEIAEILFFLMGAMVIVELIDAHDGFDVITRRINTTSATTLLWVICVLTFFFSALLDNLTTTIVMVSLLRKLVDNKELRWWFAGAVIICANAGGAWSPIGDVTTTMLWIGNQITASQIMLDLIIPSMVAALIPLIILSIKFKRKHVQKPKNHATSTMATNNHYLTTNPSQDNESENTIMTTPNVDANLLLIHPKVSTYVLLLGLGALAFVPVFKTVTHLPPYMGILFGVSILWVFTEILHRNKEWHAKKHLTVVGVLSRVDMPSILFFLGILLAVSALATAGHLTDMAHLLDKSFGNLYVINVFIGLLSALVDNVPLVAGAMKMYPLLTDATLSSTLSADELLRQQQFLQDGNFWHFLAYCAGTGGSCLIIGSASGVAAMGMEKISFTWYLKRISILALVGYLAGAATYILIHLI